VKRLSAPSPSETASVAPFHAASREMVPVVLAASLASPPRPRAAAGVAAAVRVIYARVGCDDGGGGVGAVVRCLSH
jgi:hypothetical protein